MSTFTIIAAVGQNNELGKRNQLIWHLPEDLSFFREQTMNKTIVMGYNTFCSLSKLLPGRKHVVLTTKDIELPTEVSVYHDYNELREGLMNTNTDEEIFVIGGSQIYRLFLPEAQKMLLTEIKATDDGADCFFPRFDQNNWDRSVMCSHEHQGTKYQHVKYLKKGRI